MNLEKELYDQIPDEVIPKHCPNCGESLIRVSNGKVWIAPMGEPYERVHFKLTSFDTYCNECEWSGDISPDVPEDIIIRRKEKMKNE